LECSYPHRVNETRVLILITTESEDQKIVLDLENKAVRVTALTLRLSNITISKIILVTNTL
jgi:hypothetical protein